MPKRAEASGPEAEASPELDGARVPDRHLQRGEPGPRRSEGDPSLVGASGRVEQLREMQTRPRHLKPCPSASNCSKADRRWRSAAPRSPVASAARSLLASLRD